MPAFQELNRLHSQTNPVQYDGLNLPQRFGVSHYVGRLGQDHDLGSASGDRFNGECHHSSRHDALDKIGRLLDLVGVVVPTIDNY